jgi:hypothetical protein
MREQLNNQMGRLTEIGQIRFQRRLQLQTEAEATVTMQTEQVGVLREEGESLKQELSGYKTSRFGKASDRSATELYIQHLKQVQLGHFDRMRDAEEMLSHVTNELSKTKMATLLALRRVKKFEKIVESIPVPDSEPE